MSGGPGWKTPDGCAINNHKPCDNPICKCDCHEWNHPPAHTLREIDRLKDRFADLVTVVEDWQKAYWDLKRNGDRLLAAIRKHRDQRGDDRCWMDDEELYKALPEGYEPPARDTAVEIENCKRFIASRQNPKTEYVSPEREIERLKLCTRGINVPGNCPIKLNNQIFTVGCRQQELSLEIVRLQKLIEGTADEPLLANGLRACADDEKAWRGTCGTSDCFAEKADKVKAIIRRAAIEFGDAVKDREQVLNELAEAVRDRDRYKELYESSRQVAENRRLELEQLRKQS